MLQWLGGSRRKVTTSSGSTQKRQKQYFEQRRRQQQQQTSGSDSCLEENVCSASNSERKSLDVLSLKTLSTVAQESICRSLNGLKAAGINAAGNELEISAPQPAILSYSGKPGKNTVDFVSKGTTVCGPPCNSEMKSSNGNLDLWKNEISVLDILEDGDLKYSFRENPTSEDHVFLSVRGLGKVGTETPSPPHRMEPRGGLFCSKAFRGIKMFKNPLGDLELDADAVLQDTDTSFSGKSSKFSSYSTGQAETSEKQIPEMCFPLDNMGFDNFNGSLGGVVRGKRAYDITEDYNKNRHHGHPNFIVDDIFNHAQQDLPREHGPQSEYMSEECWESRNLEENCFKRTHFFHERDTEIPMDSFNFRDTDFTTFHTPEKNINFEEVIPRSPQKISFGAVRMSGNPNQFYSHVEDPNDSSMSSEESCLSSAARLEKCVRRDFLDSVSEKREIFNNLWSPEGHRKCFPRAVTSHGHRSYSQQGKTAVGAKVDTDEFNSSSFPSGMPSRITADNKLKTTDSWLCAKEKPKSDVDSDSASFCKDSMTESEAYKNEPWDEEYIGTFADSNLGDRPKINIPKSRYAPHERAPCTPFVESYDSPWMPDLSVKSEVQHNPTRSFGVTESPAIRKPTYSMSGYARKYQEMEMEGENPLAGEIDCKPRKQKIDFFAMGIVQFGEEEEGCSYQNDRKSIKVPAEIKCPEFREAMKSSPAVTSDAFRITENENENQDKEGQHISVNPSKESETAILSHTEQRTVGMKNIASPLDCVLRRQSYFIQFMCVQQASVGKGKDI